MDWSSCVDKNGVATLRCIPVIIENIIQWALIFAGVVAVIIIIYAGFQFVTSKGDPSQVDNAKKTMTYAIIGLLFILLSFAILNFIGHVTGVGDLTNPTF